MLSLKIYKLEDIEEKEAVSQLSCGEHIIGRGPLLQCNDKRVSRKHAIIKVSEDKATITSCHVNPCYYMSSQGSNLTILPKDSPVDLNDNDKFALLTDLYWFKVKFSIENVDEDGDTSRTPSPDQLVYKRAADLDESESNKRRRLTLDGSLNNVEETVNNVEENVKSSEDNLNEVEESVDNVEESMNSLEENVNNVEQNMNNVGECSETVEDSVEDPFASNNEDSDQSMDLLEALVDHEAANDEIEIMEERTSQKQDLHETSDNVRDEPGTSQTTVQQKTSNNNNNNKKNNDKNDLKDEPDTSQQQNMGGQQQNQPQRNQPSTSNGRRERCFYGNNCFRKNPTHKAEFSHPGDDDYDSDPNDDRPLCIYGTSCYRKNPEHRRNYRHSASTVPPPRGGNDKPKTKRKAAVKKTATTADYDDSEDDYDLEDPFIDDSEDEYQAFSDDEDSDWDESQQESEKTTKLRVKEAKKFTK